MPTVRVMKDGRFYPATAGRLDRFGHALFNVGGGNTVSAEIDYTAFLGTATIELSVWTVSNMTLVSDETSGAVTTALLLMPNAFATAEIPSDTAVVNQWAGAVHRMVASDGRIINTPLKFAVQPATATDLFILDGSYLA